MNQISPPRILVGVDGSEDGLRATRHAAGRAERVGAELWLVHALDDGAMVGSSWGLVYDPSLLAEAGRAAIDQAIETATARGLPRQRIHTDVLVGHPAVVLEELSHSAEAVVVGRRAATGLERMFVGSTSTSLAATASCPLIVISAASNPGPTTTHRRVAVAVGAGRSDRALRWACREAVSREAVLEVVHVISLQSATTVALVSPPRETTDAWRARVQRDLEARVEPLRQEHPGLEVEVSAQVGSPIDQLVARSGQVDLLAVSVRSRPITGIALGGTIRGLLAHGRSPIALLR
ncbi:MAG: universal stress protein [Propionibacteriaceae bacterium]|jgi:nucleotide-binding universal stress UspA family protein|nr:universal stress protein [Propionibacteriaceae bacterium]